MGSFIVIFHLKRWSVIYKIYVYGSHFGLMVDMYLLLYGKFFNIEMISFTIRFILGLGKRILEINIHFTECCLNEENWLTGILMGLWNTTCSLVRLIILDKDYGFWSDIAWCFVLIDWDDILYWVFSPEKMECYSWKCVKMEMMLKMYLTYLVVLC